MSERNVLGMQVQLALAAAVIAALVVPVLAQSGGGIAGVLSAGAVPELVKEGFVGIEGPVGTADGGLYFSDIRANKTYRLDPAGNFSVIRENTNGSNGLALTKEGDLVFAEGDGKRISKRNKDGTVVTLTEGPLASRCLPRTISSSTPRAASTSPTPVRAPSCPAARLTCITCRPPLKSPS
jgi:hypothetical protein